MGRIAAPLLLAALVTLAGAACRGATREDAGPEPLRPVTPPQLTGAEQGLQDRVRARYDALERLRADAAAPPAELASAYGEVGKLLLSAEFLEAAEPYLLNARTLAPRDLAWRYYLAHLYRLRNRPDEAIAAFRHVLEIKPDFVPALVWLGALHLDAGRVAEAEPLL